MDQLISRASNTLVTFAVRSGVQLASSYVIKSVSTFMDQVPEHEKKKVIRKRNQLQDKIEIVTNSIEVIQLLAARGNSNLANALRLSDYLKDDIEEFSKDVDALIGDLGGKKLHTDTLLLIKTMIDELIKKIDDMIPVLNLVLTTYGTSSINNFQDYISPGRLLNATVVVNDSNEQFRKENKDLNVGEPFSLTFYNIFYRADAKGGSNIIWREKYARCKFQIIRVTDPESLYSYRLKITEDFDDGRYHDSDDGEKEGEISYDITQIKKIFFSASGRLLKLEDRSSPVLVFKINKTSSSQAEDLEISINTETSLTQEDDENVYEWIALGDYEGNPVDSDFETDSEAEEDAKSENTKGIDQEPSMPKMGVSPLALLEYLIRLCNLQANDQMSLFEIKDERLRAYLSDENHKNNVSNQLLSLNKKMDDLKI